MHAAPRPAVVLGDVSAGIGAIEVGAVAERSDGILDKARQSRIAGCAEPVADDEVRPGPLDCAMWAEGMEWQSTRIA